MEGTKIGFDPFEFYEFCDHAYRENNYDWKKETEHAFRRTIISRIYYSAFLRIRESLQINTEDKYDSHNLVINSIPNKNVKNLFKNLKRLRAKADYNLSIIITHDDVDNAFKRYKRIFDQLGI